MKNKESAHRVESTINATFTRSHAQVLIQLARQCPLNFLDYASESSFSFHFLEMVSPHNFYANYKAWISGDNFFFSTSALPMNLCLPINLNGLP